MSDKTLLNMSEAAEMVGMTRPTFYRKIKELNLSTTPDHNGRQKVEVSELIRVFGTDFQVRDSRSNQKNTEKSSVSKASNRTKTDKNTVHDQVHIARLEGELEKEKSLRTQSQEHADFLRTQIEAEKEEKNKMSMILTDQRDHSTHQAQEWKNAFEALETKVANQKTAQYEEKAKIQKILKQNNLLKRALQTEKKKSVWQKLFG